MKVAIVHTALKLGAKKQNLDKIRRLVREARERGANVVVLPSMPNQGPVLSFYPPSQCLAVVKNHAEKVPSGITATTLSSLAAAHGVFLVAGPIIERAGPRTFLTSLAFSPTGNILAKYRKIALGPEDEEYGFASGKQLGLVSVKEKLGLLAEQDVLYPEISRSLALLGAKTIVAFLRVYPSFDVRVRKLIEARSLENGVPVIAVGGAVASHNKVVAETPSFVAEPGEGIVEEIRLDRYAEEQAEHCVSLVELKLERVARSHEGNVKRAVKVLLKAARDSLKLKRSGKGKEPGAGFEPAM